MYFPSSIYPFRHLIHLSIYVFPIIYRYLSIHFVIYLFVPIINLSIYHPIYHSSIQGPCAGNQQALAKSRLWDAVSGYLHIFTSLQQKLFRHTNHIELLRDMLDLQEEFFILLISMLEGMNIRTYMYIHTCIHTYIHTYIQVVQCLVVLVIT